MNCEICEIFIKRDNEILLERFQVEEPVHENVTYRYWTFALRLSIVHSKNGFSIKKIQASAGC